MNEDRTLETLIEQYNKINGSKLTLKDFKNEDIRKEFALWLEIRKKYGYRYIDFLYEMNTRILDRTTAEVGKTELDSLVTPFDTTIISSYKFDSLEDKERLIFSNFLVYDGNPVLYLKACDEPHMIVLPKRRIDTFMTENPYDPYSIKYWNELHDSGYFDIAVGVYGSIFDKNIDDNLNMLKDLREKIVGNDYKFDYNNDNDIYYAAIVSQRTNKKIGSKTR